ncbi:hypothetical protein ACRALDRAFT_1060453 [Sodiomyces alcalophilus JCM 7366]|uniref:uncharacterized protein n=1 Tax=Sodiomyces alcalophilus JCM 7366 TaxID=591952 RepID=UPI0039B38F82
METGQEEVPDLDTIHVLKNAYILYSARSITTMCKNGKNARWLNNGLAFDPYAVKS